MSFVKVKVSQTNAAKKKITVLYRDLEKVS